MPPKTACPGDEEIREAVRALQHGAGADAFEPIFRRFYGPLFKFFANRPALREEAEDLVQTTLARACQNLGRYREEQGEFAAWLRTIAENVWRNAVRERLAAKRGPAVVTAELPAQPGEDEEEAAAAAEVYSLVQNGPPDPEQVALAHERTRVLKEAIEALPPGMRTCAELRLFEDLKYQEIADITGIGLNSVRSQLFEARKRLQPVLDHYFQGADF